MRVNVNMSYFLKTFISHKLKNWPFMLVFILAILIWSLNLNQPLFYVINAHYNTIPADVWEILNLIAYSKAFILPGILIALTFFFKKQELKNVLILIASYYLIFMLLKNLTYEARPFMVLPENSFYWLNHYEDSVNSAYKSFPSGHTGLAAIFVFAVAELFFPKSKFAKAILLIPLICVAIARICTGWHWPLDVLASSLIGYTLVQLFLSKKYKIIKK